MSSPVTEVPSVSSHKCPQCKSSGYGSCKCSIPTEMARCRKCNKVTLHTRYLHTLSWESGGGSAYIYNCTVCGDGFSMGAD